MREVLHMLHTSDNRNQVAAKSKTLLEHEGL